MNEERLKRILKAEEEAQRAYENALVEAKALPERAANRVEELLSKTREEATRQAEALINHTKAELSENSLLEKTDKDILLKEKKAKQNFDKALAFVLQSILKGSIIDD